jgi:hypothetical protein
MLQRRKQIPSTLKRVQLQTQLPLTARLRKVATQLAGPDDGLLKNCVDCDDAAGAALLPRLHDGVHQSTLAGTESAEAVAAPRVGAVQAGA